ncbi:MAG: C_GCAxxG_C_C family protein [Clostridia bacterium]|nr:C_GCAxxG_C_C family protein [Clostridia bacterium]
MDRENMTPHEARAAELFLSGAVCAQAVFCAFCDLHGLDYETAARLSSSMGGGVGRMREVCGAFSGAAMAAGLLYGFPIPPAQGEKSEHYKRIQELGAAFSERWGSVVCRDILTARMGEKAVSSHYVPEERSVEYYARRPCLEAVRLAARLLDEYIEKHPI